MGGGSDGGIGADGSFEFRNIRAGEYVLTVMSMDRGGPKILGKQTVAVGQQDIFGVSLNAANAPKVDGRVRADGEPPFAFGKLEISLQSLGGGRDSGSPAKANTDDNGGFSFAAVSRERQTLAVKTPAGMIVKAVYAAGQPLAGLDIDFSIVTGPLEIVLSNKPAVITGTVEGMNPDSPRVTVWAVPDGEPFTVESWSTKKVRVSPDSPAFTVDSLRPGSYRLAAYEEAESDAFSDAAVWEQVKAGDAALRGALFTLGAVALSAVGSLLASRNAVHRLPLWPAMGWGMLYSAALSALILVASGQAVVLPSPLAAPAWWLSLAYLAIAGSVVAFACYLTLQQRVGPGAASTVGVMTPVLALLISAVFEGYRPTSLSWLGGALALVGNVLILRPRLTPDAVPAAR